MALLFPPGANTVVRLAIGVAGVGGLGSILFLLGWARSPYATQQYDPVEQPVLFDHRHHVQDDGIDCLYCHGRARVSAYAGVPAASLCMGCHNQVWNGSALLEPVRASFFSDQPIAWARVNNLPDFVYFNHAAHVTRNVGCVSCHGRVDQMGKVFAAAPLSMDWCLGCHRNPGPRLRPEDRITDMAWQASDPSMGEAIRRERHIDPPTQCSGCHR
jgi:hypothetical protein